MSTKAKYSRAYYLKSRRIGVEFPEIYAEMKEYFNKFTQESSVESINSNSAPSIL